MTTGNYSHVDMVWEDPGIARFLRTLASFSRLIVFDRRGTGASDPLPPGSLPPWESYAQDLTAVLDEVGSEQAVLLAQFDQRWGTEAMAAMFAPSRAGDPRFCRWFARVPARRRQPPGGPGVPARQRRDGRAPSCPDPGPDPGPAPPRLPVHPQATFEGPGRAIQCAAALREELAGIGVGIRAGCTPASSSYVGTTSVAWPCTSRPG
jgi:pimeloyl-ACP methyl ester carboxylesterase